MRIREITFKDFRSFRGERRISFVDPVTDTVRPVTVLAGSNGCGKTTVLDAIEAMFAPIVTLHEPDITKEAEQTGLIHLTFELSPDDLSLPPPSNDVLDTLHKRKPATATFSVGRKDLDPDYVAGDVFNEVEQLVRKSLTLDPLFDAVRLMEDGKASWHGGILYFPHDRRPAVTTGGPIEPPEETQEWLFRFTPRDQWQGSLEHLWVWQNYLDLEQSAQDRQHLEPFVKSVERVLGRDRRITISKGRVRVPVAWEQDGERPQVGLDQLPSGEQQVLLLFGELARRRRRGAVIMIDEVENSLHPTLQRLVMSNLHRLAREWDAQVIVATHSLEVIHSVRGGAFINLDYPEDRFDLPVPVETDVPGRHGASGFGQVRDETLAGARHESTRTASRKFQTLSQSALRFS